MRREAKCWADLEKEEIVSTHWGNPTAERLGSYGAVTLKTKSGREFVVTTCGVEPQLSEVKE